MLLKGSARRFHEAVASMKPQRSPPLDNPINEGVLSQEDVSLAGSSKCENSNRQAHQVVWTVGTQLLLHLLCVMLDFVQDRV